MKFYGLIKIFIMKKCLGIFGHIKSIYTWITFCFVLLILVVGCSNKTKEFGVIILEEAPSNISKVEQALVYWKESWVEPRPVIFHFIKLDLKNSKYELFTIIGEDPDGEGPAEAQLNSPVQLVVQNHALAAVNANAFRHLPGIPDNEKRRGWFENKPVDIAGIAINNGVVRSDTENSRTDFWIDLNNLPHIGKINNTDSVKTAVSDWGSSLLEKGEIVVEKSNIQHPRTMVGFDKERRFIILVVADGRQEGYSEGISLYEAAVIMKEHECFEAVNLDGGGSSIMLAKKIPEGGIINQAQIMNRPSGRIRAIPVMLGVRRKSN